MFRGCAELTPPLTGCSTSEPYTSQGQHSTGWPWRQEQERASTKGTRAVELAPPLPGQKAGGLVLVVLARESCQADQLDTTQPQNQGTELAHPKSTPSMNCWRERRGQPC